MDDPQIIRATSTEPARNRSGSADDEVVLDFDQRFRRRIVMQTEGGLTFLLDLERAVQLRNGDALVLEDDRRIAVVAALEPLAKMRCENAEQLVRLAWHLGNRHLPVMIHAGRIYIRRDHVIERMAQGLGAIVDHVEAVFDPEPGAYSESGHGHD